MVNPNIEKKNLRQPGVKSVFDHIWEKPWWSPWDLIRKE